MRKIPILISIFISYVKADDCWSTEQGLPWGIENGKWCGIKKSVDINKIKDSEKCWASYIGDGFPCCNNNNIEIETIDMDGEWGLEGDIWCGIKNSETHWNDREKVNETKEQWNEFKNKWDKEYKMNFERLSVFVGEDESMLNFGWYSTTNNPAIIRFGTNKDMSDAKEFHGTNEFHRELKNIKYYSNKVTVNGVNRKSIYYYQRNLNGKWEEPIKFETHDPDNFSFLFMGDPQIGGSNSRHSSLDPTRPLTVDEGTRNDAFNWNMTITNSFKLTREPSVIMTAGDQTDSDCSDPTEENLYYQETQYSGFLLPELMKTIPSATAVGNHDSFTTNYRNHFNPPNTYTTPEYVMAKSFSGVIPGYSYFFKYNNVLVVVLETNYNNCNDFTTTINNAIKKYPNTDWRIAMFHHDLFGDGYYHSTEEYITKELRPCLSNLFTENKFDLVINGHDHVYTASQFITYTGANNNGVYSYEDIEKNKVYKNPKGTFYITANCSTGSKLYGFVDSNEEPDYVSYSNQTFTSTFGVLEFKKENGQPRLSITSYEVDTLNVTDGPYIFEKSNSGKSSSILKWVVIMIFVVIILILLLYFCFTRLRKEKPGISSSSFALGSKANLKNNIGFENPSTVSSLSRFNYANNNINISMPYDLHSSTSALTSPSHGLSVYPTSQNLSQNQSQGQSEIKIPITDEIQENSLRSNSNINKDNSLSNVTHTSNISSNQRKNFFDAGGNAELNKDLYLQTLKSLRNNQFVGYVNPLDPDAQQNKSPTFPRKASKSKSQSQSQSQSQSESIKSITTSPQLKSKSMESPTSSPQFKSKSMESPKFKPNTISIQSSSPPKKSNIFHPSKSFDTQPSKSYINRPFKSFDDQPSGIMASPIVKSPSIDQTNLSKSDIFSEPLNISLGMNDQDSNLIIDPIMPSGVILTKNDLDQKMGISSQIKIEEPNISLSENDFSLDNDIQNMSNIDGIQAIQDIDISLSSVGKGEEEDITTEVGNIVEPSFNFEVKKHQQRPSQTSSSGLISSPSLTGQLIYSPKLYSSPRATFGLKRMSPLYLNMATPKVNSGPSPTSTSPTTKIYRSPKQNYINITSTRKTSFTSDNSDNSDKVNRDNSLKKINLNHYNENEISKVKITKDNVDNILL
jgi:hypothetical protein